MHQRTKYCNLKIHVTGGAMISGRFHIMEEASPAVRPFDAVRDARGGVLLLTDATIDDNGLSSDHDVVMINQNAVAYIVLPIEGWIEEAHKEEHREELTESEETATAY